LASSSPISSQKHRFFRAFLLRSALPRASRGLCCRDLRGRCLTTPLPPHFRADHAHSRFCSLPGGLFSREECWRQGFRSPDIWKSYTKRLEAFFRPSYSAPSVTYLHRRAPGAAIFRWTSSRARLPMKADPVPLLAWSSPPPSSRKSFFSTETTPFCCLSLAFSSMSDFFSSLRASLSPRSPLTSATTAYALQCRENGGERARVVLHLSYSNRCFSSSFLSREASPQPGIPDSKPSEIVLLRNRLPRWSLRTFSFPNPSLSLRFFPLRFCLPSGFLSCHKESLSRFGFSVNRLHRFFLWSKRTE